MKKINLILILTTALLFSASFLSAQLLVNGIQVPEASVNNFSICEDVILSLNNDQVLTESDCEFSADFSKVQAGTNTLYASSDMLKVSSTTLDLVKIAIGFDEGFESYAHAMAADIDSDNVITTDDLILLRRLILLVDTEIPTMVKIGKLAYASEPFYGFDLLSDHTTYTFEDTEVEDGVASDIILISVGNL